jgi:hypothetical protein
MTCWPTAGARTARISIAALCVTGLTTLTAPPTSGPMRATAESEARASSRVPAMGVQPDWPRVGVKVGGGAVGLHPAFRHGAESAPFVLSTLSLFLMGLLAMCVGAQQLRSLEGEDENAAPSSQGWGLRRAVDALRNLVAPPRRPRGADSWRFPPAREGLRPDGGDRSLGPDSRDRTLG